MLDVNVLVYAYRADTSEHTVYRSWLSEVLSRPEWIGVPSIVSSGFLRVVTHPKVFKTPSSVVESLAFIDALYARSNVSAVEPGTQHWELFCDLLRTTHARGNHVPDAYIAAIALEAHATLVTADRGLGRFPEVKLLHIDGA